MANIYYVFYCNNTNFLRFIKEHALWQKEKMIGNSTEKCLIPTG